MRLPELNVLIETLWNVNQPVSTVLFLSEFLVLIETLWNVNELMFLRSGLHSSVLIETLWNVNREEEENEKVEKACINRNIVECKLLFPWVILMRSFGINRNIVECKYC